MPVGLAFRLVALALVWVAMTSCGTNAVRSFGDVAWIGNTEESYRADGPVVATSSHELQQLLINDEGHRVSLRGDVEIDFDRHYVAIIPAVAMNGCARATVDDVTANERIVHVTVGHESSDDQDGCIQTVSKFGLVVTLGRDRWSEPPEVRVTYDVPPLS